ncbi:MAG: hypothetical protein LBH25_01940 [Fibromonadaceae bacterium]|jgi:hypothetical protein|nr:hypothetical protein [Fibromonadaceae bacterium]
MAVLIEEADSWRNECWQMIKERSDLKQCISKKVSFDFRQCGTHFIKNGKKYVIQTRDLCKQAKKAGIDSHG